MSYKEWHLPRCLFGLLFIISWFLLLGSSCNKNNDPYQDRQISPQMMEWAHFKSGTYWVYQDTAASFRTDSTYVLHDTIVNQEVMVSNNSEEILTVLKHLKIKVQSTFYNREYIYRTVSGGCVYDNNNVANDLERDDPCNYLMKEPVTTGETPSAYIFYLPPVEGYQRRGATLTDYYDTYEVQGKVYQDVIRMHVTDNLVEGSYSVGQPPRPEGYETVYFYAKHYGVIRKKVKIKQDEDDPGKWRVWDLVRSNIVQ